MVMSGDAALAYRARKALDDINNLVQQNLCEIKKIDIEYEFADSVFYAIFAMKRLQENILLITRDKGLARDVLKLNKSESVRSYRPILVWYFEDNGYLNTHYHWEVVDGPAEKRCCVTCGTRFSLSAKHKAFYIERGLALPTHCLDCRAVIKKNAKSGLSSVVGKLIESLKGQLISA